jgi:hypothetical protein
MNRREYLAGTSLFGVTATAGCLEWVFPDEDEDAEAGGNTQTDGAGDDGESDEDEQNAEDETESSEDGEGGTDEHEDSNDDEDGEEGETEEEDEEDELVPDREDVEPDRDEYDEPEEREVVERDSDDVSVDANARDEGGLIVISGSVANDSDEDIDAVDLYFELYDSGDEYIGGRLVSVGDVDAGASASFEEEVWTDELRGVLARIEIGAVEVYNFPEEGN